MKNYKQSSEMQRKAEEAVNNESRLAEFERKYNDPDYVAPVDPWWTTMDADTDFIEEHDK